MNLFTSKYDLSSNFDDEISSTILLCNNLENFKSLIERTDINKTFLYSGVEWNLLHFLIHLNKIELFNHLITLDHLKFNERIEEMTAIERTIEFKSANVFIFGLLKHGVNLFTLPDEKISELYKIICIRKESGEKIEENDVTVDEVAKEVYKIFTELLGKSKREIEFVLKNVFLFLKISCEKKSVFFIDENIKLFKMISKNEKLWSDIDFSEIEDSILKAVLLLIEDEKRNEDTIELCKFIGKKKKSGELGSYQDQLVKSIEKNNFMCFNFLIEVSAKSLKKELTDRLVHEIISKNKIDEKFFESILKFCDKNEVFLIKSVRSCIKLDNPSSLKKVLENYEEVPSKILLKIIRFCLQKSHYDLYASVIEMFSKKMEKKFKVKDWAHFISICFKNSNKFLEIVSRFASSYPKDLLLFPIKISIYNDDLKTLKHLLSFNQSIPLEHFFIESIKSGSLNIVKGFYSIKFPKDILEYGIQALIPSSNCKLIEDFLNLHENLDLGKSLLRSVKIGDENVFAVLMGFLNEKKHCASQKKLEKVLKELKAKTKLFPDYFQLCYCLLTGFEFSKKTYDQFFKFFLQNSKEEFALDLFKAKKISLKNEEIIEFLNDQKTFFVEILEEVIGKKFYPQLADTLLKSVSIGQWKIIKILQKHSEKFEKMVIENCFEVATKKNLLIVLQSLFEYKVKEINFMKSIENSIINDNLGMIKEIFNFKKELDEKISKEDLHELLDFSLQHLRYSITKKKLFVKDAIYFYFISKGAKILSNNLFEFLDTTAEILRGFIKAKKTNIDILGNQLNNKKEYPLFCIGNDERKAYYLLHYGISSIYDKTKNGKSLLHFYGEKNEENEELFHSMFENFPELLLQKDKDGKYPNYFFKDEEIQKLVKDTEKLSEKTTVKKIVFKIKCSIKDLPKMDPGLFGKCDSYFVIYIGDEKLYTSSTVKKNYHPKWDQFEFSLPYGISVKHRFIVRVFSSDKKEPRIIGSFEFFFYDVVKEKNLCYTVLNDKGNPKHVVSNKAYHPMFSFDTVKYSIVDREELNPKREILEKITFRFNANKMMNFGNN